MERPDSGKKLSLFLLQCIGEFDMQQRSSFEKGGSAAAELDILHAGLGLLMARFPTSRQPFCTALWISRQLRLIADHPELPDPGLRPLYRTMAARWHVRAWRRLNDSGLWNQALMEDAFTSHGLWSYPE